MGTKKREESRARARTKREEARRRAARRKAMTTGGLVVAILGVVAVVVFANRPGDDVPAGVPRGTRSFEITARNHVDGAVSYEQTPPAGGDHNPVWQNCGFYSQPVVSENAVHSMEHGAVWITYSLGLPSDAVDHIREVADEDSFVLATPFPGLPVPVVASAWGRQLTLDDAADERLEQFVRAFSVGPQTPEPGAPCTGGTGEPE
ncbi:MAG: DUF3105 domain-containing protein [Actinomycetota bacterium]